MTMYGKQRNFIHTVVYAILANSQTEI